MSEQLQEKKRLPRSYYPIFTVAMVLVMAAAIPPSVVVGLNPYIGMALAGGFWVLREVWVLRRKGY